MVTPPLEINVAYPRTIEILQDNDKLIESLTKEVDSIGTNIYGMLNSVNQVISFGVAALVGLGALAGLSYRASDPNHVLLISVGLVSCPLIGAALHRGTDAYIEIIFLVGYRKVREEILLAATGIPLRAWDSSSGAKRASTKHLQLLAVPLFLFYIASCVVAVISVVHLVTRMNLSGWQCVGLWSYSLTSLVIFGFVVGSVINIQKSEKLSEDAAREHWDESEKALKELG